MGVGGQHNAQAAEHPRDLVRVVQKTMWAPEPVWTDAENLAPTPGFDSRTAQPVASH